MNTAYVNSLEFSLFSDAREQLEQMIDHLQSGSCAGAEHGAIEQYINQHGHELLRRLLQGYLDLQATNEPLQQHVITSRGDTLNHVKPHTQRQLTSLFGSVTVSRKGYSQRHKGSEFPLDEQLNLPADKYSDGLRHRIVSDAIHCAYDSAVERIQMTTAGHVPKRQAIELAQDVAQDFESFGAPG